MTETQYRLPFGRELCQRLGIRYPIFSAGMDQMAGPELTAAVSNAGGMGVLGAAGLAPDVLQDWIDQTRSLTSEPFGVDTLLPAGISDRGGLDNLRSSIPPEYWQAAAEIKARFDLPDVPGYNGKIPPLTQEYVSSQIDVIAQNKIPLYVSGLGDPSPYIDQLHKAGTTVMALIGSLQHARSVVAGGVDAVIAQGHEGGGHNSRNALFTLLPSVVEELGQHVPVLAAGGIVDGRGVAAGSMLGASGAWIGTRFLLTPEARIPGKLKQYMVSDRHREKQPTVISKYRTGKPVRMMRSVILEEFEKTGLPPLPMPLMGLVTMPLIEAAQRVERYDLSGWPAGAAIEFIHDIVPAGDVVAQMVKETRQLLSSNSTDASVATNG